MSAGFLARAPRVRKKRGVLESSVAVAVGVNVAVGVDVAVGVAVGTAQSMKEVFQFLGKRIGQSREATAVHPQCVILFFNVTRGNQINNRIPRNRNPLNIHHLWRRISALFLKITVAKGFDD